MNLMKCKNKERKQQGRTGGHNQWAPLTFLLSNRRDDFSFISRFQSGTLLPNTLLGPSLSVAGLNLT